MIARKYAGIARREAEAIAEGRQWYPTFSRPALVAFGWLNAGDWPNNVFDLARRRATPIQPMNMDQVLTALAMVIAVAESQPLPKSA